MSTAYLRAAAWWDADLGPPHAEILPRADRIAASFVTRILAHVLARLQQRTATPLGEMPWVLGGSTLTFDECLIRCLGPRHGLASVHAAELTVPMTLFEALGALVDHEQVLVAFAEDATPPYNEPHASALLLARSPSSEDRLRLHAPRSSRISPAHDRRDRLHPAAAPALRLARAGDVGQPTVETIAGCGVDQAEFWRIELSAAF